MILTADLIEAALRLGPALTVTELARRTGLSVYLVQRALAALRAQGRLEDAGVPHVGSFRGGRILPAYRLKAMS